MLIRWDARTGRRLGLAPPACLMREGSFLVAFTRRRAPRDDAGTGARDGHPRCEDARAAPPRAGLGPARRLRDQPGRAVRRTGAQGRITADRRSAQRRHARPSGATRRAGAEHGVLARQQDARECRRRRATRRLGRATRSPAAVYEGHAGPIASVSLSDDGRTAYTASLDGTVIAWDLGGSRQFGRQFAVARMGRPVPSSRRARFPRLGRLLELQRRAAKRHHGGRDPGPLREHRRRTHAPDRRPRPRGTQALEHARHVRARRSGDRDQHGSGRAGVLGQRRPPVAEAPGDPRSGGGRCWRRSTAPTATGSP